MPTIFQEKKARIIQQLDVPEGEYNDLSPKGSVDIGIRELLAEINAIATLVTTSSCAGRVCVYVEGQKQPAKSFRGQSADAVASSGGKGGGKWLFVSHDPVNTHSSLCGLFGLKDASAVSSTGLTASARLIHFKFEAMVWTSKIPGGALIDTGIDSTRIGRLSGRCWQTSYCWKHCWL
jgi:tRNA wybutosine-synthesizing protein 3